MKVDITQIKEVRIGLCSQEFLTHGSKSKVAEDSAISIVYAEKGEVAPKILNLVAADGSKRDWWKRALNVLMEKVSDVSGEAHAMLKPWLLNLRDGKDTISWKTALDLLHSLGMYVTADQVKKIIAEFDVDGDARLNFGEFLTVMRKLRSHQILSELFKKYAKDASMSAAELLEFLKKEQGETNATLDDAQSLIKKFSPEGKAEMDEATFQLLMISEDNSIWIPEKRTVHHDMTQSISHYFIDSSHNTYLAGDQLKSDSSIEMYVRALRLGCRCVELDMWNGEGGEPIVYHGHTLTSKILFSDILRVIKYHGFITSPYPVILSLENHCSKAVQDRVAYHLETILGDMVVRCTNAHMDALPSPESLKHKVLVKGTPVSSPKLEAEVEIEEDGLLTEAAAISALVGDKGADKNAKPEKISEKLSNLIFLQSKHFSSFEESLEKWEPYHMASFSEVKTLKILSKEASFKLFQQYNAKLLSRIYPKGTRVDSSNYDPCGSWKAGCQIVALNYQTSSAPMWINHGKFIENGLAGYNLRPEFRKAVASKVTPGKNSVIRLRVLGGRLLPQVSKVDMLDPYVKVELYDETGLAQQDQTEVVQDNALNPNFTFSCDLKVKDWSNTYVILTLWDKNTASADVRQAHFSIPVSCIRPGYRVVKLLDDQFAPISRGMCHLLVKVEFL